MSKILIAYYSRADENYFGGAMRYVKVGNTEIVAMRYVKVGNTEIVCNIMKELLPADSFKIEMKNPYSPVYMTCIEEAKKDLRAKARPELLSLPDSIDGTGAPCRWLFSPSWSITISPAKPSCRSAPTRAAAWAAASGTSSALAPARS